MLFLSALLFGLAQQPIEATECVNFSVPNEQRAQIGEAILERRPKDAATSAALSKATDDCARQHRWSAARALNANGFAAMRMAAEAAARQLGYPEWADIALATVRERSPAQRENLANTGTGAAEFELVLMRMVHQDRRIASTIQSSDAAYMEKFVLMVKLLAVAEVERDQALAS